MVSALLRCPLSLRIKNARTTAAVVLIALAIRNKGHRRALTDSGVFTNVSISSNAKR